jgi:hypothetical protein
MPGPAPKDKSQRAHRAQPTFGEWVTIPPLSEPVLPELPPARVGQVLTSEMTAVDFESPWHPSTKAIWSVWRTDWVTGIYTDTEVGMALALANLWDDASRNGKAALWSECRQWMDRLGLTLKGKRDLRLRAAGEPIPAIEDAPADSSTDEFSGLRLVDDALAS